MIDMNWFSSLIVKLTPGSEGQAKPDEQTEIQHLSISDPENDAGLQMEENLFEPEIDPVHSETGKNKNDKQATLVSAGQIVSAQLLDLKNLLHHIRQDTSPHFVQVGRDLQAIVGETKTLTDSIHHFASCGKSNEGEKSSIDRTKQLIHGISQSLTDDQHKIESDLKQIHKLLDNLSKFQHVYETIDSINSSFKVVRINIQIQCNVQSISEDLFKGVSDDITSLSHKLNQITKNIKQDLFNAEKNMSSLNRTITKNLQSIKQVSTQAKGVVSKAFAEIKRLVQGGATMMQEVGDKSETISQKVNEVVISIQFHDTMSQRFEHIVHAFNDIRQLLQEKDLTPGYLGNAFFILDLQYRQLVHLTSEVSSIHGNIENSFESMGSEVETLRSTMKLLKLNAPDQHQRLGSQVSTLRQALLELCDIFSQGEKMVEQINSSTSETKKVADNLVQFMEDIQEMREETRLQAANTIIMASSLGKKGKTIAVLAKEIRSLSDKTSAMTDNVTEIQQTMNILIEDLGISSNEEVSGICHVDNLGKELEQFRQSCREFENGITDVSHQIDLTITHIRSVRCDISFLAKLKDQLIALTGQVHDVKEKLAPWQDKASSDSRDVEQLIERYTMEKERMVHRLNSDPAETDDDIFLIGSKTEYREKQKEQTENIEFF